MSTDDQKDYQKAFYEGQARINYELVRVNKKLIEAINTLIKLLQADRSAHGLKQVDLTGFEAIMTEASVISEKIAGIDPPGCLGPPPY